MRELFGWLTMVTFQAAFTLLLMPSVIFLIGLSMFWILNSRWVDTSPDMADFDESMQQRLGRKATDAERQNRKQYWQFEKLHCIREHLDRERRKFYENMFARHGEPELADLNSRISSGWQGNDSPMTVDDLITLTFEQAVERVSSWEPQEPRFMGPDIEGLFYIWTVCRDES